MFSVETRVRASRCESDNVGQVDASCRPANRWPAVEKFKSNLKLHQYDYFSKSTKSTNPC